MRLLVLCLMLSLMVVACSKDLRLDDLRPHHTSPVEVAVQIRVFGPLADPGQPLPEAVLRLSLPILAEGCREQVFMPRVTTTRVDLDRSEPLVTPTYKELRATFDKPAGMDVGGEKILERAQQAQKAKPRQAEGLLVQPAQRAQRQAEVDAELARQQKEAGTKEAVVVLVDASQQEHYRATGATVMPRGESMSKALAAHTCELHKHKQQTPLSLVLVLPPVSSELPPVAVVSSASAAPAASAAPTVTPSQLPLVRSSTTTTAKTTPTAQPPAPAEPTRPGTTFLIISGRVAPDGAVRAYLRNNADNTVEKNARLGYTDLGLPRPPSRP